MSTTFILRAAEVRAGDVILFGNSPFEVTQAATNPVSNHTALTSGASSYDYSVVRLPSDTILTIERPDPPTPEWDRPEVFAVVDGQGGLWHRRLTAKGRVGTNGLWQCGINIRSSSDIVATRSGPFTIVAEVHQ